jgi:CheY-like chemotaxis protein/HPt (histidine-containing phosphotransfer) domain-containing protein
VQLNRCGLRAAEATSTQEALEILSQAQTSGTAFDVALINQQMPDADAGQFSERLTHDARYRSLRLVLLTAAGRRGDARKYSELGYAAYLLKPVTERDLADCLSLLLGGADNADKPVTNIITRHQLRAMRSREQRTLLLVDDNPVNQKVTKALVERMGFRTELAYNGAEALAAWERTRFDAILMDCQMPIMDGYQATREIRQRENGRHIPIIAVTAHAMSGAEEECLAAGMDAYQSKPLDRDLLQQCLDDLLSDTNTAPEIDSHSDPGTDTRADTPSVDELATKSDSHSMSNSNHGNEPPVDWSKIAETAGDDVEFAQELVQTFGESSAQSIAQIANGLAANDLDTVRKAAHSLKGASASMGAMTARTLASSLEESAKANNASACALHFEALRAAVKRAEEYMHERVNAA